MGQEPGYGEGELQKSKVDVVSVSYLSTLCANLYLPIGYQVRGIR